MSARVFLVAILMLVANVSPVRAQEWRMVDPEDLVVMDVVHGRVLIELAPAFAPKHSERFRALVRARFYDGQSFYRVVDGFVAQGGIGEFENSERKVSQWPPLKAEFDRIIGDDVTFTPMGSPDLFADEVGHVDGFPVGRDRVEGRMWLLHCPGAVAMARDNDPDTGDTEFYIPIGHAPRQLDRNLTVFGRVLEGMQYLQKLNRGDAKVEGGVIQDAAKRDRILRVQMAADMDIDERPCIEVMNTLSATFEDLKTRRRNPAPEFYVRKPSGLDISSFNVPIQHSGPCPDREVQAP